MKSLLIICAVAQASAFFQMGGQQAQPQPQAAPVQHTFQMHFGQAGQPQQQQAGANWWMNGIANMAGLNKLKQGMDVVQNLQQIPSMMQHQAHQGLHGLQAGLHHLHQLQLLGLLHRNQKNFYENCGSTLRHCDWHPKPTKKAATVNSSPYGQTEEEQVEPQPEPTKPEMEQICWNFNTVCVGNTEHCVQKGDCDVAMRITEKRKEGKEQTTQISAVQVLDRCDWGPIAQGDNEKVPEYFLGVGFATYSKAQELKCRHPKAKDFKLVFLQKNPIDGVCKHKALNDTSAVKNLHMEVGQGMKSWPTICRSLEAKKEDTFTLKNFVKNHISKAHFTKSFAYPFTFADNFEFQTSADGMVITGTNNDFP